MAGSGAIFDIYRTSSMGDFSLKIGESMAGAIFEIYRTSGIGELPLNVEGLNHSEEGAGDSYC